MKKNLQNFGKVFLLLLLTFLFQLFTFYSFAQSPQKFNYQAVCRDNTGAIIASQSVNFRLSIRDLIPAGTIIYQETQTASTNAFGTVTLEVGGGTIQLGTFNTMPWETGDKYFEVEIDMGSGFISMGTTQLLSVPYALHAKTAETFTGTLTETDPIWTASPSYGITNTNITNWTTAYDWGNHATAGYLTSFTETDPLFVASPANGITNTNIANWTTAYSWGNHATAGYLTTFTESDPIFVASPANGITNTNIANWTIAYGWGNHASAGYLTTFTETDPTFLASPANGILSTNITNWNAAFGWGNHATAGYLTSFTETDPLFVVSPANGITNTNITNWNTAFGWGNHSTAGYLTSYTETDPIYTGSQAANITATDITNLSNLSGVNTGDQDLSSLATKTALGDSTAHVRSEIPDVSGFLTAETDPSVPTGTQTGEMQYWNGTAWVVVPVGTTGQLLSLNASAVPEWQTPSSLKSAATQVPTMTSAGVTFNGVVNANGLPTTVAFEYGTDLTYGTTVTATQSPVSGTTNTAVTSAVITTFTIGTTYHVRLITQNIFGTFYGDDITFTYLHYGASYAGGLVFSIDNSGQHGLVCATADQSTGANWNTAFTLCAYYNDGGFNDWYLPSESTLNLMYVILKTHGLGGFAINNYWSSSDYAYVYAWRQNFDTGDQDSSDKNGTLYVRAVRAF